MRQKVKFTQICIEHLLEGDFNYLWALDTEGRIWYRKAINDSKWVKYESPEVEIKEDDV